MADVVTWRPSTAGFERLNREWIEAYFALEHARPGASSAIRRKIVRPGGQIFFVVDEDGVRGDLCAAAARARCARAGQDGGERPRLRGEGTASC